MKRSDSSRLCKELAGLSPWGWDSRVSLHPPGPASKRDFSEVDKLALHHQIDPAQSGGEERASGAKTKKTKKSKKLELAPRRERRRDAGGLPAKIDDIFGGGVRGAAAKKGAQESPKSGGSATKKRERKEESCTKIKIKLSGRPPAQEKKDESKVEKAKASPAKKGEKKARGATPKATKVNVRDDNVEATAAAARPLIVIPVRTRKWRKWRGIRKFQPKVNVRAKPMSTALSSACAFLKAQGW
mmetsp:Transcript_3798/g.13705  ORF Transcript_3798/g.13705 Transcript_3798/m.13705 type:complete len:243 (-) Transcript_3798:381-1109(-)